MLFNKKTNEVIKTLSQKIDNEEIKSELDVEKLEKFITFAYSLKKNGISKDSIDNAVNVYITNHKIYCLVCKILENEKL